MVNRTLKHFRDAFTMLELIFAIVIIGLVAITIPTILMTNARNVETNLLQEAVLIAATKMGQTLSYPWDENSPEPGITLAATDVVTVNSGDSELQRVGTSDFRRGHFQEALRRRMTPNSAQRYATLPGNLGSDGATDDPFGDDDIDDISGATPTVISPPTGTGLEGQGIKATYTISGTAKYVSDAAAYNGTTIDNFDFLTATAGGTTNIKMIEISVDSGNTAVNPDIVFRAWASNIGETDYYKRTY